MTERRNENRTQSSGEPLGVEDRRLVDWMTEHYQPEPETFEQRTAFDRRLRTRLAAENEHGWMGGWLRPAPALAAAVALASAWLLLSSDWRTDGRTPSTKSPRVAAVERPLVPEAVVPEPQPSALQVASLDGGAMSVDGWTGEVLSSVETMDALYADDDALLPDEYLAIESVFLGGV